MWSSRRLATFLSAWLRISGAGRSSVTHGREPHLPREMSSICRQMPSCSMNSRVWSIQPSHWSGRERVLYAYVDVALALAFVSSHPRIQTETR